VIFWAMISFSLVGKYEYFKKAYFDDDVYINLISLVSGKVAHCSLARSQFILYMS
jgi:hypothetical protein